VNPSPVRLGLLSTASINDAILASAAGTNDVDVVAVASRDAARAEAYAAEHGIARGHGAYERILDDPGIDAVYLSLPNGLHHEWTMRALEAGKHVLVEKPFTRSAHRAEEAFELARHRGLVLLEAFQYRHHPQTAEVKRLLDDGVVGRVQLVRGSFSFLLESLSDVRADPALDGGALMDVGCYCVSIARFLLGEPERVWGEQVVGPTGVDMAFHGTLRFPGDLVAQFDCSFTQPQYERLDIVGDHGWLLVDSPWRSEGESELLLRHREHLRRFDVPAADAFRLQLENFAAAVAHEAAPLIGAQETIAQARTIEALYRSAAEGRSIDLDEIATE
jgi:D-xylose 1-dehydrogenase (NADP+, D-xylono-1,5-lactone-forming)